ncbi:endolytic transglycosylase MltG [Paucidesulfovibrio longus]|uniref:endolytic transglycosylase MltG n=1 Tax=Paucidesulfovibrio longus TaxID=889 RepID=UPI0003B36850|nr:endolytic transglycosylase MltG [Paucidesulfovibrio longus]
MAGDKPALRYVAYAGIVLCLGMMAVGSWFLYRTWTFLNIPPEDPGRDVRFVIEPGQHFLTIARGLKEERLISDVKQFLAYAQDKQLTEKVKAGEFLLNTGWLPDRVLTTITSTPGILHRFTVREGLTWWQVADLVQEAGLGTYEEFDAAVHDPKLLAQFNIPADSAEGYLFPETYMLTRARENSAHSVAEMMVREFFKNAEAALGEKLPDPEKLHKLVILASIVEKETGDPSERPAIAGVYVNRLNRPMRLQADPTIIYGLGPSFNGNLRQSDLLDASNPYNTYQHDGLPPGPICSPGRAALAAAAHPEDHGYVFFVAKGDGTHHFSKTLREHNDAVGRYQKWGRNRKDYTSQKREE